jgi:GT2 family glycosyltransferase
MDATHRVGMCGTVVRYYHQPDTVQALNGSVFNWWTGQSRGIGMRQPAKAPFDPLGIARQTDFVLGASLAVSRAFLETVGPMDEGYFLYFEELDWAVRNGGRFATGFAHGATVFHKEGGSIGSSGTAGARSAMSEYWLARARLRFARKHNVLIWPWYWLITLAMAMARLLRGRLAKSVALFKALFGLKY